MSLVLVASDLPVLRRSVRAAIEGAELEVIEATEGREAIRLAVDEEVDLAVLDLQIGSMGAVAICHELRNLESAGEADHTTVLMLLDRRPDVFLARRCGAEGFCMKPLEPVTLRRAVRALLAGESFADSAWRPVTVGATAPHG
jgi:DNA-binding NarL/FixJ family response regulator